MPGEDHGIVLMRRDGTLQSIPVTPGSAANKVVLQSIPSEAIETEGGQDGIRTIFSFGSDGARNRQAFLVQSIGVPDGQYIELTVVNYSDSYYEADGQPIPPKELVIN
ncbi:hypothetical protein D3C86_1542190 [compost metagenome]